jgi:hypothetical protein
MNGLKMAALGTFAALGLASAAIAQPQVDQPSGNEASPGHKQMEQGNMAGMMTMMNDPEMRQAMMEMMHGCNKMMQMKQEKMSGANAG